MMKTRTSSPVIALQFEIIGLTCSGSREIIWLESDEVNSEMFACIVNEVAEAMRPFPVVGLRQKDQTIMSVNDAYFTETPEGKFSVIRRSDDRISDRSIWNSNGGFSQWFSGDENLLSRPVN